MVSTKIKGTEPKHIMKAFQSMGFVQSIEEVF